MRASYQICRVVKVQQSRTEFEWVWSLVFGHDGKSQMEKMNLLTLCHIKLLIIRTSTLSPALIPAPSTRSAWVGGKYYNAACLISITFGLKQRNTYTFPSGKKPLPSAEFSYLLHFIFMILHKLYSFGTFVSHMIVAFFTSLNCVLINQYFYLVIYSE